MCEFLMQLASAVMMVGGPIFVAWIAEVKCGK